MRQRAYTKFVCYRFTFLLGKEIAAVGIFQFLHADALHTGMGDYLFTAYMGGFLNLQFFKDGLYLHIQTVNDSLGSTVFTDGNTTAILANQKAF